MQQLWKESCFPNAGKSVVAAEFFRRTQKIHSHSGHLISLCSPLPFGLPPGFIYTTDVKPEAVWPVQEFG
jgi:hypothetical protein